MSRRLAIDPDGIGTPDADFAAERRHQLVLAIAGDAADAENLAAGDGEADVFEVGAELLVGRQRETAEFKPRLGAGWRPAAMGRRLELAADHEFRQALGALLAGIAFGHDPAEAQDRRPLAERLDLLELVADVEDGAAFA